MSGKLTRRTFIYDMSLGITGIMAFPFQSFGQNTNKVTLIGDSIRMGYQPYVALYLMDKALFWGPEEDCKHSVNILSNTQNWFQNKPADIIHINSGLEDIKVIPAKSRKNLISPDVYADNITRIIKFIHVVQPDSAIIWATTTPVIDELVQTALEEGRGNAIYNDDVIKYNEVAVKTVTRLGVPVNDLYSFVMDGDPKKIMLDDGVHFSDTGYQFLGEQVANAVEVFLK